MKSRVDALLSHRINNGVDNTGNVRVWDAEATLAGFLLSALLTEEFIEVDTTGIEAEDLTKLEDLRSRIKSALFTNDEGCRLEKCNILEMGAGQAGLAGLALAEATSSVSAMKPIELFLTDGHPKCVENNRYCAGLIRGRDDVNIHTKLLLWDSSDKGAEECRCINRESHKSNMLELDQNYLDNGSFHICLASDCVHFQDFHDGLFCTIARTLAVGGIALLCQPKRGSSLQNFMSIIDTVNNAGNPLFQIDLLQDFHPKVSNMHRSLLSAATANTTYDPNWHRPLLLVMTKLRAFDEAGDGEMMRQASKA
jgi:predicted nicotinamide N-methyase